MLLNVESSYCLITTVSHTRRLIGEKCKIVDHWKSHARRSYNNINKKRKIKKETLK